MGGEIDGDIHHLPGSQELDEETQDYFSFEARIMDVLN